MPHEVLAYFEFCELVRGRFFNHRVPPACLDRAARRATRCVVLRPQQPSGDYTAVPLTQPGSDPPALPPGTFLLNHGMQRRFAFTVQRASGSTLAWRGKTTGQHGAPGQGTVWAPRD